MPRKHKSKKRHDVSSSSSSSASRDSDNDSNRSSNEKQTNNTRKSNQPSSNPHYERSQGASSSDDYIQQTRPQHSIMQPGMMFTNPMVGDMANLNPMFYNPMMMGGWGMGMGVLGGQSHYHQQGQQLGMPGKPGGQGGYQNYRMHGHMVGGASGNMVGAHGGGGGGFKGMHQHNMMAPGTQGGMAGVPDGKQYFPPGKGAPPYGIKKRASQSRGT